MRIGNNPEKENKEIQINSYHRVIIPVYIPNLSEEYFVDSLKILKICIESLLATVHEKTRISLINNNCCEEVVTYLKLLFDKNKSIDQVLNSKVNLGKVNAIYSIVKSNLEPLITISDSDVMFLPNWQQEVEKVLNLMPEAGMVSPVPSSKAYSSRYLYSTVFYGFFKSKLKFSKVKDPNGLLNFQKSIGRDSMYNKNHLSKYLTVGNSKINAVLGCGHFVATLRAEVFKSSPNTVCKHKIVGGSENEYIDKPNDKAGFLRLATLGNYAYHLGNKLENWMLLDLEEIKQTKFNNIFLDSLSNAKPINKLSYRLGSFLHFIFFRKFKKFYFRLKGLKGPY